MNMRYFRKSLLTQNQFRDRYGKTILWEQLPGNTGVIALNPEDARHAQLIEDLSATVGKRGIVEINALAYENVKKNRQLRKFAPKLSSFGAPIRVLKQQLSLPKKAAAPAAPAVAEAPRVAAPVETKPPGGDQQLADASVPPKPKNISRARKVRVDGDQPAQALVPA